MFAGVLLDIGVDVHGLVQIEAVLVFVRLFGGLGEGMNLLALLGRDIQQIVQLDPVFVGSPAVALCRAGLCLDGGDQLARLLLGPAARPAVGGVESAAVGARAVGGLAALVGIARVVRIVDGGVAVGELPVRVDGRGLGHFLLRAALFQKAEQPALFLLREDLHIAPAGRLWLGLVLLLVLVVGQVLVQIRVLRVEVGVLLVLIGRVIHIAPRRQIGQLVGNVRIQIKIVMLFKIIHVQTPFFLLDSTTKESPTRAAIILSGSSEGSPSDFSPRKAKNNSNPFFPGRVPRKKHFSVCKCASVPRKRVRAADCIPLVS